MVRFIHFLKIPVVLMILPGVVLAADVQNIQPDRVVDVSQRIQGRSQNAAKAAGDTVYVFGGPGTLEGKFEAGGLPSDQGWTGVDETETPPDVWKRHTFMAANLDPLQVDNHAWWCGDVFQACTPEDTLQGFGVGYGNGWDTRLFWSAAVPDPDSTTSVTVEAVINYDVEPGYDYVVLGIQWPDRTVQQVLQLTGKDEGLVIQETVDVDPAGYTGDLMDEVRVVWRVSSDLGYSDEDCRWTTSGAVQIDNIAISFIGVQVGDTETCEPGTPSAWSQDYETGVGDFSKVWPALQDGDRCYDNNTPVLAFIDDGEVVPGTGGYLCQTYCYGPGGYIVNPEGGLAGPEHDIHNYFVSPNMALPDMAGQNLDVAWDVFRHNIVGLTGIFYLWYVQSTDDPTGLNDWSSWKSRNFFYEGGPYWSRHGETIGDLLVPDAKFMRLKLGIIENNVCGSENTDGTPAPYFDNVAVKVYPGSDGPKLSSYPINQAQDGFPDTGLLDFGERASHSVRFDMARDLNAYEWDASGIDPGDTVTVKVEMPSLDWSLVAPPRMYYRLRPNPLYDAYRTSGLPNAGSVEGTPPVYAWSREWSFDLPDTGFIFPGDQLHYYYQAEATNGSVSGVSILPADTTGFSSFLDGSGTLIAHYDEIFTVRGLPSVRLEAEVPVTPPVLFWDEGGSEMNLAAWRLALAQYGMMEGIDYDTFSAVSPGNARTGLGTRATLGQISGYQTLLIDAGDTRTVVLEGIDSGSTLNPRPDLGLLTDWLDLPDRRLLVMGDRVLNAVYSTSGGLTFVNDIMGLDLEGNFLEAYIDGQDEPTALSLDGNPVFPMDSDFFIAGCSLRVPVVDLERVLIGTAMPVFEWADPNGAAAAYTYSAGSVNRPVGSTAKIAQFPYTFVRVESPDHANEGNSEARLRFLTAVFGYFGTTGTGDPTPVPLAGTLLVGSHPNPFNPTTTIAYDAPRSGHLDMKVYDLSGRLVRTLANEVVASGPGQVVWDGRDASGRGVSSGVYFCRVTLENEMRLLKLALIK